MPIEELVSGWRAYVQREGKKLLLGKIRPTKEAAYQDYLNGIRDIDPPLWHRLTGIPEVTRKCLGCAEYLPINDFYRCGTDRTSRRKVCISCMARAEEKDESLPTPPPPPPHSAEWYRERIKKLRLLRPRLAGRIMSQKRRIKRGERIEKRIRLYYHLLRRAESTWTPGVERAWDMELEGVG